MDLLNYLPEDLWDIIGTYLDRNTYHILIKISTVFTDIVFTDIVFTDIVFTDDKLDKNLIKQIAAKDLSKFASLYATAIELINLNFPGKRIDIFWVMILLIKDGIDVRSKNIIAKIIEVVENSKRPEFGFEYKSVYVREGDLYSNTNRKYKSARMYFSQETHKLIESKYFAGTFGCNNMFDIWYKSYEKMMSENLEFMHTVSVYEYKDVFEKYLLEELRKSEEIIED